MIPYAETRTTLSTSQKTPWRAGWHTFHDVFRLNCLTKGSCASFAYISCKTFQSNNDHSMTSGSTKTCSLTALDGTDIDAASVFGKKYAWTKDQAQAPTTNNTCRIIYMLAIKKRQLKTNFTLNKWATKKKKLTFHSTGYVDIHIMVYSNPYITG